MTARIMHNLCDFNVLKSQILHEVITNTEKKNESFENSSCNKSSISNNKVVFEKIDYASDRKN